VVREVGGGENRRRSSCSPCLLLFFQLRRGHGQLRDWLILHHVTDGVWRKIAALRQGDRTPRTRRWATKAHRQGEGRGREGRALGVGAGLLGESWRRAAAGRVGSRPVAAATGELSGRKCVVRTTSSLLFLVIHQSNNSAYALLVIRISPPDMIKPNFVHLFGLAHHRGPYAPCVTTPSRGGLLQGGAFHRCMHGTRSTIYALEASHNGVPSSCPIHNGIGRFEPIDEAAELDRQQRRLVSTNVLLQHVGVELQC
jgi:hypothetical protein